MGTKATVVNGEQRPSPIKRPGENAPAKLFSSAADQWRGLTRFLSDVRAETRKVVTPSRKEVEATTTVVIIAVFIFGLYFFVVDGIFRLALDRIIAKMGGY